MSLATFSRELEALVARASPAVVSIERGGQGSGLLFTPDGYVLTNAHVVEGARRVRVGLRQGDSREARVVGRDPRTDLAVVSVDGDHLPTLPLAARERAAVGQIVVAIGNPLALRRSISLGVISALDRGLPTRHGGLDGLLQTDAAINPGNSGGPLVTAEGEVIGIATAMMRQAQGIGFAVPAWTAAWVASALLRDGAVRRPTLGILAERVEVDVDAGHARALRVRDVNRGSPAHRAGLRSGDVLLAADTAPLDSVSELQRVLVLGRGREVTLEVLRDGRREQVSVAPSLAA